MSPAAEGPPAPAALALDVRAVAPKDRLETLLGAYDALGPGELLDLLVDHDPECLYYTLRAEREPGFGFEYVERGPARWRVLVTRPAAAR